jgi:hypothetical protein
MQGGRRKSSLKKKNCEVYMLFSGNIAVERRYFFSFLNYRKYKKGFFF